MKENEKIVTIWNGKDVIDVPESEAKRLVQKKQAQIIDKSFDALRAKSWADFLTEQNSKVKETKAAETLKAEVKVKKGKR